jgi:hypothetical protein
MWISVNISKLNDVFIFGSNPENKFANGDKTFLRKTLT